MRIGPISSQVAPGACVAFNDPERYACMSKLFRIAEGTSEIASCSRSSEYTALGRWLGWFTGGLLQLPSLAHQVPESLAVVPRPVA